MIQGITPQIIADISSNSQSAQKSFVKLPPVNSLIDFKVLDKIGDSYKILVKGFLFQAKLPVNLLAGDELIGRVISQKPFTILLDNLFANKGLSSALIGEIIGTLNLKDSSLIRKIISEVVKSDKPLAKSKLNKLIELTSGMNNIDDELLINLMINILWSNNEDFVTEPDNGFNSIFDTPFDELVSRIVFHFNKVHFSQSDPVLNDLLKNKLILDIFEQNAKIDHSLMNNRDDSVLDILDLLESRESTSSVSADNYELKTCITKYLLQKAVYHRFQLSRDFIPFIYNSKIKYIIFTSTIPSKKNNPFLNVSASINTTGTEGGFTYNVSEHKIIGEIKLPDEKIGLIQTLLEKFNKELSEYFNAPVSFNFAKNNKNMEKGLLGSVGSINVKV